MLSAEVADRPRIIVERHILRKLDVSNRTQIAAWYLAPESPRRR